MAFVFPGMDPWLEHPQIWTGVHSRLAVYLADQLQPLLEPRYIAAVEERVYIEAPPRPIIPDVWVRRKPQPEGAGQVAVADADEPVVVRVPELEIHEPFIDILDRHSGQRVVTVIEIVSPHNKFPGTGRELYLTKQQDVLNSNAHLAEIDLLRVGQHVLAVPEWVARGQSDYDYLICVNRAQGRRDAYDLYPRTLRQRLPKIRVPLADEDPDVPLDLQAALTQVYEAGRYADRIDDTRPCQPPLDPRDHSWAEALFHPSQPRQPEGGEQPHD